MNPPRVRPPGGPRGLLGPALVLALGVAWTSWYVNWSFAISDKDTLRFLPPFRANWDRNWNAHLGGENWSIAKALYAGEGFASPFREPTGPTAWMPPALPALLAALLWANAGDPDAVMNAVICLQAAAVIGAGWFVLAVARQTVPRVSLWTVAGVYAAGLVAHFTLTFQMTHDCWLVLLGLTAILAWACAGRPLGSPAAVAGWGVLGGASALTSPVLGFVWAVLTATDGARARAPLRVFLSGLVAVAVVAPWVVRNYRVFARVIPVKSNLGYELYQSQCLEPDGVIRLERFTKVHPYGAGGPERAAYKATGEMAYLDAKTAEFVAAVRADPASFARKAWNRFLAATLVYVPLDEATEDNLYWGLWISRTTHALPFLSALVLLGTAPRYGLGRARALTLLAYAAYLAPYAAVSYYERYAVPLVGVKVLLVVWAAERLAREAGHRPRRAETPAPGPAARHNGPMLHRWAAGLAVCAGVGWWYASEFADRLMGPKYDRFGDAVMVPDFFQEWHAARMWWDGQPPYAPMTGGEKYLQLPPGVKPWLLELNAHPPGAVLLALPLGTLDFTTAFQTWNLLSLWALAGSLILALSRLRAAVPLWAVPPAVTACVLSVPFWNQITHGQLNLVLLLLLVGAWAALTDGRPAVAGVLVGVAAGVKLFPGFLLLYFAFTGRWRAMAGGVAGLAAVLLLSAAVLGWDVWWVYFSDIVPHTKEFSQTWTNASLPGWWLKLFDPGPGMVFQPWPIVRSRAAASAGAFAALAALVWVLWRQTRPGRPASGLDRGFGAAVTAALLIGPITWDHYFVLLLLPAAFLWRDLAPGWHRMVFWLALAVLATSPYALADLGMTLVGELPDWSKGGWESPPWLTATILSVQTYALLALLALLLFARSRHGPLPNTSG